MNAKVIAMGYLIAESTRLSDWRAFAQDVHGMVPVIDDGERLRLRLDARDWRVEIQAGDTDAVTTVGWEVRGPAELAELGSRLTAAGFTVTDGTPELRKERRVTGLLSFTDPDGLRLELFHGQSNTTDPWQSATGATFVTGDMGLGHIMQFVSDSDLYRDLYMGILGFELSDFVDIGPDPGTFLHCNPRHHSMAFASFPGMTPRVGHLMVQVDNIDTVGRAYDRIQDRGDTIGSTFGRHSNDEMISYYVKTPGDKWEMEYGYGGIRVDEDWQAVRWDAAHLWGHRRGGVAGVAHLSVE